MTKDLANIEEVRFAINWNEEHRDYFEMTLNQLLADYNRTGQGYQIIKKLKLKLKFHTDIVILLKKRLKYLETTK